MPLGKPWPGTAPAKTWVDGGFITIGDPRPAHGFGERDVDLWAVYDRISCPTLALRGARSELLLAETATEMTRRGPRATVRTLEGVGHAPALIDREQIALLSTWLGLE